MKRDSHRRGLSRTNGLVATPRFAPNSAGFKPGSATQVVVGLLVAMASVVIYARLTPFVSPESSTLGIIAMLQVCVCACLSHS